MGELTVRDLISTGATQWADCHRYGEEQENPHANKQTNTQKAHAKGIHLHKELAHLMMMKVRRSYF